MITIGTSKTCQRRGGEDQHRVSRSTLTDRYYKTTAQNKLKGPQKWGYGGRSCYSKSRILRSGGRTGTHLGEPEHPAARGDNMVESMDEGT